LKYCNCLTCDAYFEMKKAERRKGRWYASCPDCGCLAEIDIDDYVVPTGTYVKISPNHYGEIVKCSHKNAKDYSEILYLVLLEDDGEESTFWAKRSDFTLAEDWRKIRRDENGFHRVCHYPANQEYSNVPCYNCADRAKCSYDIYAQLNAYEESDMQPDLCQKYGRLNKELRKSGLTFAGLMEMIAAHKAGELYKLPCPIGGTLWRVRSQESRRGCKRTYFVQPITFNQHNLFKIVFGGELNTVVFASKDDAKNRLEELKIEDKNSGH